MSDYTDEARMDDKADKDAIFNHNLRQYCESHNREFPGINDSPEREAAIAAYVAWWIAGAKN